MLRRTLVLLLSLAIAAWTRDGHAATKKKEATVDRSKETAKLKAELREKYGEKAAPRIDRGVDQVARLWQASDGDLGQFVREHFIGDQAQLDQTFERLESIAEQLDGHMLEMTRELKTPTDLDVGPLLPVDPLLAGFDPSAHVVDDLFKSKIGFVCLLNFPLTTLKERLEQGKSYSRRQWAEVRLAGRFGRRVPAEIQQEISRAAAAGELYIAEYNVWMHHLVDDKGQRLFPKGMRLISHWNLRDELKADYTDKQQGIDKQRMIVKVMERIVSQTIPRAVIDNPRLDWNPFTNQVTAAPAGEVEENAPKKTDKPASDPEPNVRFARLLDHFESGKKADAYSPVAPTMIARSFDLQREIPEERVRSMFEAVLGSPLVPKVAQQIESKLGRKLEPQDIWYSGFQPRGKFSDQELDAIVKKKYPTKESFAADIPRILTGLGFSPEKAKYVSSRIVVDASRGAGHALPSARRGDYPHLRTRVEADGMNYKGYNIAVHELGHNVEQVFSLYEVDHTLLSGVPNNAFTEALAFVFQARDLELLGLAKPDAEAERARVLNDFWMTWEIAGVALVDTAVWHWMYDHPRATPAELKDATVRISKEHWNKYYAPVLGGKDSLLLGIYSHMIAYPMYLPDYPIGHMIAFQIEEQVKKSGKLGEEFERMAKFGSVTPDLWMEHATGHEVTPEPLLRATEAALAH
jgi:hypothetical protein